MDTRKNKWRLLALVLLAICIYSVWNVRGGGNEQLTNQDFIRFHVIANSDSDEDQALKLKVRDGLLEKINGELVVEAAAMAGVEDDRAGLTLEQSQEYIQSHLAEIEAAAVRIVEAEGYDYGVTAELGARFVPEKTYGSVVFPAGNYEALNVTIGTGQGRNWWCVLFPPLCLIGAEVPEEMQSDILAAEIELDPRYRELVEAAHSGRQTTLKLEFKTLDYLKRID
ncbi:stage II sporulation protein R [Bacilliculturomica massiliensis]|uniref:stage II sporulation protein R n=1 Tax=Bacilliculturomica massiliensis TaxID=1917867 RepID=UPI001031CA61|nr:stage II sporulation protein R [Bacilliculturomica massiliensis]